MSEPLSCLRSSGITGIDTATNAVVELIAARTDDLTFRHVQVLNTSQVVGFFSIDGGTTWVYLPASGTQTLDGVTIRRQAVQLKRVADAANVTGVFAAVW